MTNAAILLDVPNLLRGRPSPESPALLARQLAAIDRCALALFGEATLARDAFALDGITARAVGEALAAAGYSVTWCPSERTRSMDLKKLSRADDYDLQRTAKARARAGARSILIASADRDPEDVAFDLQGTGVRVAFGQWDPIPTRRPSGIERVCLLDHDVKAPVVATASLRREGHVVAAAPLRDGLVVGRASRTHGVPDLDLATGATDGAPPTYSRRVGVFRRLGETWCFWRLPDAEIEMFLGDGEQVDPGGCVPLPAGETVLTMRSAGAEIVLNVPAADGVER
jgi:hypothetical protein